MNSEEQLTPEIPIPENPIPENPIPENPIPENPIPENPIPENPTPEIPIPENPTQNLVEKSFVDFENVKTQSETNGFLFENFLYRGQTLVINSAKGIGSTWLCIEFARAISSLTNLFSHYEYCDNQKINTVIMLEGTTPVEVLKERIDQMQFGDNQDQFKLLSKKYEEKYLPKETNNSTFNIADVTWRDHFKDILEENENNNIILIFDTIDPLILPIDKQVFDFEKWVKDLHSNPNITQIWVDKGGIRKFKVPYACIDLEIELKAQKGRGNVALQIEFIKANLLKKEYTMPFVIELQDSNDGTKKEFKLTSCEVDKQNMAIVMMIEGLVQTEIAKRLKVSQPMVSMWKSNAIEKGLITTRGNNSIATPEGENLVERMRIDIR